MLRHVFTVYVTRRALPGVGRRRSYDRVDPEFVSGVFQSLQGLLVGFVVVSHAFWLSDNCCCSLNRETCDCLTRIVGFHLRHTADSKPVGAQPARGRGGTGGGSVFMCHIEAAPTLTDHWRSGDGGTGREVKGRSCPATL